MADVIEDTNTYHFEGGQILFALFFCLFSSFVVADSYDRDVALEISQAAVGQAISDYELTDTDGNSVRLQDFRGKPLLISMIFTSCHHICPTTTKHLGRGIEAAEDALGEDTFSVVTIGFDTATDTPDAMRGFANRQNVGGDNWKFLSGSEDTIAQLSSDLGFQFFPSARGFDHLNQLTVIDRDGKVYSQVYGVKFELPWLVEPLKQLVFNRPESAGHFVSSLVDRVRLFCTVYNPASGRYEIDNSLFFRTAVGFMVVFLVSLYLWREFRRPRKQ
jgi:protein SCO1/2